jgi:hypothetical protein
MQPRASCAILCRVSPRLHHFLPGGHEMQFLILGHDGTDQNAPQRRLDRYLVSHSMHCGVFGELKATGPLVERTSASLPGPAAGSTPRSTPTTHNERNGIPRTCPSSPQVSAGLSPRSGSRCAGANARSPGLRCGPWPTRALLPCSPPSRCGRSDGGPRGRRPCNRPTARSPDRHDRSGCRARGL